MIACYEHLTSKTAQSVLNTTPPTLITMVVFVCQDFWIYEGTQCDCG